jgi:hypothetical protein
MQNYKRENGLMVITHNVGFPKNKRSGRGGTIGLHGTKNKDSSGETKKKKKTPGRLRD